VKVQGEFTWHKHPDTDEFFLVLDGELKIQMREGNVALRPRELSSCLVVPSTVRAPMSKPRCSAGAGQRR
jgi:mannose-6-phosphate isomerase-like protein (cupin superfamily)